MHLTLKLETTKPAGKNFLQQQAKFDDFVECFNNERPHQALNMPLSGRALRDFNAALRRSARARMRILTIADRDSN
jgi:hypothetical protein